MSRLKDLLAATLGEALDRATIGIGEAWDREEVIESIQAYPAVPAGTLLAESGVVFHYHESVPGTIAVEDRVPNPAGVLLGLASLLVEVTPILYVSDLQLLGVAMVLYGEFRYSGIHILQWVDRPPMVDLAIHEMAKAVSLHTGIMHRSVLHQARLSEEERDWYWVRLPTGE